MSQFIEMFGKTTNRVSLSSLCDTFIDGDWIEAKDQSESGIRLIQTGNVGVGIFKDKGEKARYISEETFNRLNCTEVVEGDILISRLPDPVGRACIIPGGLGKTITAVDCTILRLKDLILPKFFIAFTNTPDYAMQIKKVLSGTTRLRVSRTNLGNIEVPLPSFEEQLRFVSIALQADKSEFVGFKSQFIEMFGDPSIDTKWPTKKLKELGSLDRGVSKARPRNTPELLGGPYPLIQTGDITEAKLYIKDYHQTYSELGLAQSKMWKRGTLCITIAANIAQTAILDIDACFPDSVVGFISNEVETIFIHYWFSFIQQVLERQAPQTAQKNINLKILSELDVIVPPKELQTQFVNIVLQADKSEYVTQGAIVSIDKVNKSYIN
jgi:type I restriction enzyme S subunit